MNPYTPRRKSDRENQMRDALKAKLEARGWYVKITHGNAFQSGLPDLYATHSKYGIRWIECKLPEGRFTSAQLDTIPKMSAHGSGVWVLVDATDAEIEKLFGPENWFFFLKSIFPESFRPGSPT